MRLLNAIFGVKTYERLNDDTDGIVGGGFERKEQNNDIVLISTGSYCLAQQEVELCKQNTQEKLGLTLCYRTDEDDDMAIYVSQVQARGRRCSVFNMYVSANETCCDSRRWSQTA